jgi:hypothetical protein
MTHTDFDHLLGSIKALSPEQVRQLRQQLDRQLDQPRKPPGKTAKRAKSEPKKKPLTEEEFNKHLLSIGLLTALPDPALDLDDDDPEDEPVTIKGEPLSETILRERR